MTFDPLEAGPDEPDEPEEAPEGPPAPPRRALEAVDVAEEPPPFDQLRFVDVVVVLPSTNPVVVLEEVAPPCRVLRIPIGTPEGVAIAYAAKGIATPKPLTHELFMSVLVSFGVTVDYLRITGVRQNAFTAELVVSGPKGSRTLPCRPSDGIALALRQRLGAPIMVAPDVLDEVGVEPGDADGDNDGGGREGERELP